MTLVTKELTRSRRTRNGVQNQLESEVIEVKVAEQHI